MQTKKITYPLTSNTRTDLFDQNGHIGAQIEQHVSSLTLSVVCQQF